MALVEILLIFFGGVGLWLVFMSASGGFARIFKKKANDRLTLRSERVERRVLGEKESVLSLPLRLMRSFRRIGKVRDEDDAALMLRLMRAGLPFYSPQHYYSRQLTYTLLMAAVGLLVGTVAALLVRIPPIVVVGAAFLLGVWGSSLPGQEVQQKIKKRRGGLILDMTFQITRLRIHLDVLGQIRGAMSAVLETAPRDNPFSEFERKQIEKNWGSLSEEMAVEISMVLSGIGGNYFAELLNRFSLELSRGVAPDEAAEAMKRYFEPSFEMDSLLKAIVAGIKGEPVKERLLTIDRRLHRQMRKMIREAGARAESAITVYSAMTILPLFIVILVPLMFIAMRFIGGN